MFDNDVFWGHDIVRGLLANIDKVFYDLLSWVYELFFSISTATLFTGESILAFFNRIQLILGVLMIFKLTISVLQMLVDPDKISDKNNGASSIIMRVVTTLLMLTLLVPINIPNATTNYEKQLNNNGLLFGVLYELQNRLLADNTLGKLILGPRMSQTQEDSNNPKIKYKNMGKNFVSQIAKGFMKPNKDSDGSIICPKADIVKDYDTADYKTIIENINEGECSDHYAISYVPILGVLSAGIFAYIFFVFCLDIAIRAIKLSVLRLIAPIPIISYMDPKQAKDGAFASWIKALISVYLDLFLRLATIYFVLFLINDIADHGISIDYNGDGFMGTLTFIVIAIGLLLFAKEAPRFLKGVLGIKGMSSTIGAATLLGGSAMLGGSFRNAYETARKEGKNPLQSIFSGIGGAASGFAQGAVMGNKSASDAAAQGKNISPWQINQQNKDFMAKMSTGDKDAHGGISGWIQDRISYNNRELAARRLGLGRNAVAAADYESKILADRAKAAQKKYNEQKSILDAMRGVTGGKMSEGEYINKMGSSDGYNNYSSGYDSLAKYVDTLEKESEAAEEKAQKAEKLYKKMDDAGKAFDILPRGSDIYGKPTYRSPRTVRTNDDGIAIDENDNEIVDTSGNALIGDKKNDDVRKKYTFKHDPKSYSGSIDDAIYKRGRH